MKFSICRREHQSDDLRRAAGNKRIAVLVAAALIAGLLGLVGTSTGVAQVDQSLTVDPSAVPTAGTYDFTLTPSGFTSSNVNLAICNTADPNVEWRQATLIQYCGGFGSKQDAMSGPFTVEGVEVGEDGVSFFLFEPVPDGEAASATVIIEDADSDESSDVQTDTVTFSGTVTASGGISTDGVVVSVAAWCWGHCDVEALPERTTQRPRLLDTLVIIAETEVDSSGSWSITVPGIHSQSIRNVNLMVWDTNNQLATRFIGGREYPQIWNKESVSGIEAELEAGGRVSGRFADSAGNPPARGDYALVELGQYGPRLLYALNVDPQTGEFTSRAVTPGNYSLAHGNHGQEHLTNNDATRFQITAGQTSDVGTVTIQQPGQISGTVTDSNGKVLSGISVSGVVSSENSYWSMPYSPFSPSGSARFWATSGDDGTYTAPNLYPGDDWQIEIEIPVHREYTAIAVGCGIRTDGTVDCGGAPQGQFTAITDSCAIRTDGTIACWGDNRRGQADAPSGTYTAIATGGTHSCAIRTDTTIACWGSNFAGQTDAPAGAYTAIAAADEHSCAIRTDGTIACWGGNGTFADDAEDLVGAPAGEYIAIAARRYHSCAIGNDGSVTCWGLWTDDPEVPSDTFTAIAAGLEESCGIRTDGTIVCWNQEGWTYEFAGQYTAIFGGYRQFCALQADGTAACWYQGRSHTQRTLTPLVATYHTASEQGINVASGGTVECSVVWNETPEVTCSSSQTEADDETAPEDESPAERCFAVHKFGAQPVDVAKTANRETVLAQLSWGFHESIGCFLTLDEAALGVLQAAPAPASFPAADPVASQQCFDVHKFGAQPVDVAKSADRQTVLAQVRWGFHQSIGCYLTLDTTATAALRAAHT